MTSGSRITKKIPAFFALFTVSFTAPVQIPELAEHGREVDNFIIRTIDRISEAWTMCRLEFRLVADSRVILEREAKSRIEGAANEAVQKAVENVADKVVESAREEIHEKLSE